MYFGGLGMDINEIQNISKAYEQEKPKKIEQKEKATTSKGEKSDEISISDKAKSAYKERSLVNLVKELPEIRTELVSQAKAKISSGEIFSKTNIEKTAEQVGKGITPA